MNILFILILDRMGAVSRYLLCIEAKFWVFLPLDGGHGNGGGDWISGGRRGWSQES